VKQVKVTLASQARAYQIKIGRGLLQQVGRETRRSLRNKARRAVNHFKLLACLRLAARLSPRVCAPPIFRSRIG